MSTETTEDPIVKLQNLLNEANIKKASLEKQLSDTNNELMWITEKYNTLVSTTFQDLFDLTAKVRLNHVYKVVEQRNEETTK